jgi:fucose permease
VLTVTALVVLGLGIAPLFPLTVTLTLDAARWQQRGLSDEASGAATGAGAIAGIAFPVLLGSIADRTSLQGALLSLPLLATGLFAAVTVVAVRIRRPMRSEDGDGRSRSRG